MSMKEKVVKKWL